MFPLYGCLAAIFFLTVAQCQNNYYQQSPAAYQTPAYGPSPKPCGIPNYVPGTPFNPQNIRGTWYSYRVQTYYCPSKPKPKANVVYLYTTVGSSSAENYNLGELQTIKVFFYDTPNDYQCHTQTWLGSVSNSGIFNGQYEGVPASRSLLLFNENIHILYYCVRPNPATGICDQPSFEIQTRLRPDYMTQQQSYDLDKNIDYVLGRYGIYAADVPLQAWIGYKQVCTESYSFTQSQCVVEFMENLKMYPTCTATY